MTGIRILAILTLISASTVLTLNTQQYFGAYPGFHIDRTVVKRRFQLYLIGVILTFFLAI
jgi:hypothetical protein